MDKRLRGALHAVKRVLYAIGLLVLLFYLVLFATMTYQYLKEPVVDFDDADVQYVFQWLHQKPDASQLLDSYYPPANWAGDYEKIFALKLEPEVAAEIVTRAGVVRGDGIDGELEEAVAFAMFFTRDLSWFPSEEDILTAEYYLSPIRIIHKGGYPDSVHLVIVQPEKQILYFVAAKM